MKIHIVQKGDTLWKISKKYGVDFEDLKKMNSQLSNPDLIMPGMKIKVPAAGVQVKKEGIAGISSPKEMPISDHPFAKEKPIIPAEVPDVKPKETPQQAVPYVPPAPALKQPLYPEIDINNYYTVNMAMLPSQPKLPPKPANVFPSKEPEKTAPLQLKKDATKTEEAKKDMANYGSNPNPNISPNVFPNVSPDISPNVSPANVGANIMPNISPTIITPNVAPLADENIPPQVAGAEKGAPAFAAPEQWVPVSPVLPGSGLCPPYGHPGVAGAQFGPGPAYYPQHHGYGFHPYHPGCWVPVSPVLPGSGLHHGGVMGAYQPFPGAVAGAYDNMHPGGVAGAYDNMHHGAVAGAYDNMHPGAVAGAFDDDCGCGDGQPGFGGYGAPGGFGGGVPGAGFGGYGAPGVGGQPGFGGFGAPGIGGQPGFGGYGAQGFAGQPGFGGYGAPGGFGGGVPGAGFGGYGAPGFAGQPGIGGFGQAPGTQLFGRPEYEDGEDD
nr:SafA/ExsA family spore coat assembly protein [Metabacillus lacus]